MMRNETYRAGGSALRSAENAVPPRSGPHPLPRGCVAGGPGGCDANRTPDPDAERQAREDLRWYLVNKYRAFLVDKLTREDLEELQYYHGRQYDPRRGWDHAYQRKFVLKLREYMNEEILKREIAGIEALVTLMKPEDLAQETLPAGSTTWHGGSSPVPPYDPRYAEAGAEPGRIPQDIHRQIRKKLT
jgi:hypothetical protein